MIYLASPYSGPAHRQKERFLQTERFVAYYFRLGVPLLSPIIYCHQLALRHELPGDAAFWSFLNEELLQRSACVWVLKLDGWDQSIGVAAEIKMAQDFGLDVHYKEPLPW